LSETQLFLVLYVLVGLRLVFHLYPKLLDETWHQWQSELIDGMVVAGVTALLLINFVVRSFFIPSGSMEPTLQVDDYILVNEFIYRFVKPQRGDIVVFKPPESANSNPDHRDFIKRIVGIEGDVIEVRDGALYRNGFRVQEPYVAEPIFGDEPPVLVKPGHLFMMGDNRNNSQDSRYWGQLPEENVVGKAFLIFLNWREKRLPMEVLRTDQGVPVVADPQK